jgi:hypothetical protein
MAYFNMNAFISPMATLHVTKVSMQFYFYSLQYENLTYMMILWCSWHLNKCDIYNRNQGDHFLLFDINGITNEHYNCQYWWQECFVQSAYNSYFHLGESGHDLVVRF